MKSKIIWFLDYFFILCFSILISGFYIYGNHGALQNIVFGILSGVLVLRIILLKEFKWNLNFVLVATYGLIFFTYVIALYIDFQDTNLFLHGVSNKALILIFPLLFAMYPLQSRNVYFFYFWIIIVCSSLESTFAYINYRDDVLGPNLYGWSGIINVNFIPFFLQHHHLGILIVFSLGLLIHMGKIYWVDKKYVLLGVVVIAFLGLSLFLHILSARISLLLLYLLLIYLLILLFKSNPKVLVFICLGALFVLFLFSKYDFKIKTLSKRFQETVTDIKSITQNGTSNKYNISGRLFSAKLAIPIIKNNLWKGVGINNYESTFKTLYELNFPDMPIDYRIMPPNQFIRYLVCMGLPLSFLFFLSLYTPLIIAKKQKTMLFLFFYIICTFYFLTEFPLDINDFFYFFSFSGPFLLHYNLSVQKFYPHKYV